MQPKYSEATTVVLDNLHHKMEAERDGERINMDNLRDWGLVPSEPVNQSAADQGVAGLPGSLHNGGVEITELPTAGGAADDLPPLESADAISAELPEDLPPLEVESDDENSPKV